MIITNKELAKFLTEYPLYSKIHFCEIKDKDYQLTILDYFDKKAYKFYCPIDKDYHTFKFEKSYSAEYIIHKIYVPESYLDKERKINICFHLSSTCQICGFRMDLLLNLISDEVY